MPYKVFATDFDGTIAHDGAVDEPTLAALRKLKASGVKLVLCTGRELADFLSLFSDVELFDLMVMENGALLYDPATKKMRLLAPAPPEPFVQHLRALHIPLSVGHSVVATFQPHGQEMFEAVQKFKLEWHVIFNKDAIMCLPSGVTKASGLKPALEQLGLTPEDAVAAGDAENDQAMLAMVGLAVAPANALDEVKQNVDLVTAGARGEGVTELIDRWLTTGLDDIERKRAPQPQ